MKKIIRVGSRESKLAVVQTKLVMDMIKKANPDIELELITMKTTGDIILDRTLDKVGGKGLFVKELDLAMMDNKIDIAVHSLKDMPMEENSDMPILALSKRENPYDALVLPDGIDILNDELPIGCSSLRRIIQLKKIYPNMDTKSIRGNVITRLAKLDNNEYSALVLAAAGLNRLGLGYRVSRVFTSDEIIPSAGQGVLAIQGRKGDDTSFLKELFNQDSWDTSMAERSFVRTLDGGCSSPIAAYATVSGTEIKLSAMYVDNDNNPYFGVVTGDRKDGEKLGYQLANKLKGEAKNG